MSEHSIITDNERNDIMQSLQKEFRNKVELNQSEFLNSGEIQDLIGRITTFTNETTDGDNISALSSNVDPLIQLSSEMTIIINGVAVIRSGMVTSEINSSGVKSNPPDKSPVLNPPLLDIESPSPPPSLLPPSTLLPSPKTQTKNEAEIIQIKKDAQNRRMSVDHGVQLMDPMDLAKLLVNMSAIDLSAGPLTLEVQDKLLTAFMDLIISSGGHYKDEISTFIDGNIANPTSPKAKIVNDNIKSLLVLLGIKLRSHLKLSRVGLGVRLAFNMLLSYIDLGTDGGVIYQYYKIGKYAWACGACVAASLSFQVIFTGLQYYRQGPKTCVEK